MLRAALLRCCGTWTELYELHECMTGPCVVPQVDEAETVAKGAAIMASRCFATDPPDQVSAMYTVGSVLNGTCDCVQYDVMS